MPHDHHSHHHHGDLEGKKLFLAVVINLVLTIVQIIAGLLSGSLALVADALHNLGDAGSLVIANVARRIARVPASSTMTYGFRRAEIIAAAINGTALLMTAAYLVYEAIQRAINPVPVNGWVVVGVASLALAIDGATVWLTHKGAKDSLNIRAAYIHNLTDALASVGVIISGIVVLTVNWVYVDTVITILIAIYVFYHSLSLIKQAILILMQAAPRGLDTDRVRLALVQIEGIEAVPHMHIWQLGDKDIFFECQAQTNATDLQTLIDVRCLARAKLKAEFQITHSTLEMFSKLETPESCLP